jgi:O-antigen/teichoic acid export membrane protein
MYQDTLDATYTITIDIFTTSLALMLALYFIRIYLPKSVASARPTYTTKKWLRTSIPMLINNELTVTLKRIDIILVGVILGTTEAGIYAVASKIAQLVTFGLKSSNVMAAPLFAGYYAINDKKALQSTVTIAAIFATIWCLFIGGGLIAFREMGMRLFGEIFVSGSTVLIILCIGNFGNALTGPAGILLDLTGHQDITAKITTVIVVVNVFFSAPAIFFFGINGAAIVTATLIILKNLWCLWEVRRNIGVNSSIFPLRKFAAIR